MRVMRGSMLIWKMPNTVQTSPKSPGLMCTNMAPALHISHSYVLTYLTLTWNSLLFSFCLFSMWLFGRDWSIFVLYLWWRLGIPDFRNPRQGHLQTPEVVMEELGAIQVLLVKKYPALTIVMLHNVLRISWLVGDYHIIYEFPFFTRISLNWIFFPPKSLTAILWEHVFLKKYFLGLKRPHFLDKGDILESLNSTAIQQTSILENSSSCRSRKFRTLFATTAGRL